MRRLTNKNQIIKLTLQSLPIVLVAIAFCIYASTFLPLSQGKMCQSVALVEYQSHYEIAVDGRSQLWFDGFGDSLKLRNVAITESKDVVNSRLLTGVWVNRYAFFPSCRGRILLPTVDTTADKTLAIANSNVQSVIQRAISDTEKLLSQLDKKQTKLNYYLSTHNVSDDGYNTMAAFAAAVDSSRNGADGLLSVLKGLTQRPQLTIRHIEKYTLLYSDADGKTVRQLCHDITKTGSQRFKITQTDDQKTPTEAAPLYFHSWLNPTIDTEKAITVAAYHGSSQAGFSTNSLHASCFSGTMTKGGAHDVPTLFAPNGSPVFTVGGRLLGVSVGGRVYQVSNFNLGFNDLLP